MITLLFLPAQTLLSSSLLAGGFGLIQGQTLSRQNEPLSGVRIILKDGRSLVSHTSSSDERGLFRLTGLPAGEYSLGFEALGFQVLVQEKIAVPPSQSVYVQAFLVPEGLKEKSVCKLILLDYTSCIQQTVLDESQIHDSPSGHNVWFLVENQDLSATTNRIDVGGIWGSAPALFSARGGCSWTQNTYQLNGLDVTDPYWTGMPLFYPDFFSLQSTQLVNAGHPPQALSPGGMFNLTTRDGSDVLHGSFSSSLITKAFQSSNISQALKKEGMFESHTFNYLLDENIHVSGPLKPGKLTFFSSFSTFLFSRDVAEFNPEDKSSIFSGLFSLKYISGLGSFRFLWTGQSLSHPSSGSGRKVPRSATSRRKDVFHILQAIWEAGSGTDHFFQLGFCLAQGSLKADFQKGFTLQHGLEVLRNIPSGSAPLASKDDRLLLTLLFKGESLFSNLLGLDHRAQYGFQIQRSSASSEKEIIDNLHLHFFQGKPLELVRYNTPTEHREAAFHWNLFFQDTLSLKSLASFYLAFNLSSSRGWTPGQNTLPSLAEDSIPFDESRKEIRWLHFSPRLGLILPLTKSKTSALKFSLARYYFLLPLNYLSYGNPEAWGGKTYVWKDLNSDKQFQEGEAGSLIKREGPYFSSLDPDLKRPYTDELTVSYEYSFGSAWYFSLSGFYRETRNLIETTNIGVPFSAYDPVTVYDKGDDRIPSTPDDLFLVVYNQKKETLGNDFFLLTNPDSGDRITRYYGLDLILLKKIGEKFRFFLSLTATSATGKTGPGNTEWENDDGVLGSLYDNPNTLIHARGRVRFDRAYTGRAGFFYQAPLGIKLACTVKYYDGQPFTRKIIIQGFNQGPFYIQAFPRGVARYEYNRTVELRLEKIFPLGKSRLRVRLDVFNLFNRGLATEENEWTGPEFPLRFATEIQSPRVFRLGLAYEF